MIVSGESGFLMIRRIFHCQLPVVTELSDLFRQWSGGVPVVSRETLGLVLIALTARLFPLGPPCFFQQIQL
jgi:hypothetical protein